jgi:hypothetical protein
MHCTGMLPAAVMVSQFTSRRSRRCRSLHAGMDSKSLAKKQVHPLSHFISAEDEVWLVFVVCSVVTQRCRVLVSLGWMKVVV